MKHITPQQRRQIKQLHDEGHSLADIVMLMGVSWPTVRYWAAPEARRKSLLYRAKKYREAKLDVGKRESFRLTQAQRDEIVATYHAGVSVPEIARRFQITTSHVHRLRRLADRGLPGG